MKKFPSTTQMSLVMAVGVMTSLSSCAVVKQTQASWKEWREKSEARRVAREDAATPSKPSNEPTAPPIFLDYTAAEDPSAVAQGFGAPAPKPLGQKEMANAFAVAPPFSADLPGSVGEFTSRPSEDPVPTAPPTADIFPPAPHEVVADAAPTSELDVFLPAPQPVVAEAPALPHGLTPETVSAWAGTVLPLTGASLAEPFVTAALTAHVSSDGVTASTDAAPQPAPAGWSVSVVDQPATTPAPVRDHVSVPATTHSTEHEADWTR